MKLATKLTLVFLALSITPLGTVGYLAFKSGRGTMEQRTLDHLTSVTMLKEDEFNRWVEDSKRSLQALAMRPLFREYAAVVALNDMAHPEYREAHRNILVDHLKPKLQEEGGFLELFILRDSDGLIVVSTDKVQEGKYREIEPFFVEGKSRTYVQNVYYSLAREQAIMTIGTPIIDKEGLTVAVLAGHVNLAEMSKIMVQARGQSATEETYLVNKFNFFVTESRFEPGYALRKGIHTDGVAKCLAYNNGVGSYNNYRGVPVIGAYRWMPERELCILTEIDQAEAFAPIVALRNTVVQIGIAIAAIVTFLGVFFARTITRPVRQLVKGTTEVGRGNLDYRIQVESRDEIGELSGAFDQMTQNLKVVTTSRDELDREAAERKLAEEELQKYTERLQEMVNERTKELQEAQEELIRKERLAVLGQMAGAVNHELRNPLGVIKNSVYYLKMVLPEDEKVWKHLGILEREVGTASQIVGGLLDLARPQPTMQVRTDLSELVRESLEQTPLQENIRVVTNLPGNLPPVSVDPDQVKRVVCNLIMNAAQAMPSGGTLTIETAQANGGAQVTVSDTGEGIARENLEKIFQPLFTTKAKGIGLGLYLARRLTETSGGTIAVESTAGSGSRFVVRFAAQKSDQQQEEGH